MARGKRDKSIPTAYSKFRQLFDSIPHSTKPPSELTQLQVTATLLISKTIRTSRAIFELWKVGLSEDMSSLSRGIMEIYITLKYLHEHGTELEVVQFAARSAVKELRQAETMVRIYPKSKSAATLKLRLPELREKATYAKKMYLDVRKRREGMFGWIYYFFPQPERPKSMPEMAKKIKLKDFGILYPDFSGHIHPDAASAPSYVRRQGDAYFVVLDEPDYDTANIIFRIAMHYIIDTVLEYAKIHKLPIDEKELKSII